MQVTAPWNDRVITKIDYEVISSLHVEHPLQTTQQHYPNSATSLRPVRYPQNHPSLSRLKCPGLNTSHSWTSPSVRMTQHRLWPLLEPSSIIAPWWKELKRLNSDERARPYTYSLHTRCPIKHHTTVHSSCLFCRPSTHPTHCTFPNASLFSGSTLDKKRGHRRSHNVDSLQCLRGSAREWSRRPDSLFTPPLSVY